MLNIMNNLVDYMTDNFTNYSTIVIDVFQGENESIMVRHEPSQIPESRYFDGSRTGTFNFTIHAKSLNPETATNQLNSYIDSFDLKGKIDIDPLTQVKIEPKTSVRFISKTDKAEYIYSSSFELEYFKER